jgi:type VI protein secretion system component Hcp
MRKVLYAFLIFQALFFSTNAFSQGMFLKVQLTGYDFNGGALQQGYLNQVEVASYSDGISGCAVVGTKACVSATAGFNFMTLLSNATIDFKSVQLQNKIITSADLTLLHSNTNGVDAFYKIHMEDVRVVSVQESACGERPAVSVSLQPARIAWQVISQTATGQPGPVSSYGWDFKANAAFSYTFPPLK